MYRSCVFTTQVLSVKIIETKVEEAAKCLNLTIQLFNTTVLRNAGTVKIQGQIPELSCMEFKYNKVACEVTLDVRQTAQKSRRKSG